jgi:short-subunit dehydrogenase
MSNETVLITGAAHGIGLELAREFARNGHPLILTARSESELENIASDLIDEHGVQIRYIAADFNDANAAQGLADTLDQENVQIDILVNNAGLGQHGKFWEIPLERDMQMINVNIAALLMLSKSFLPKMVRRGGGRILNTASIAGFMPAPNMAVYHATKAFVLSFSEALATELKDTGVTVTALCPGATDTNFFPEAELTDTAMFQKGNVMAPQEVAKIGYEALMKGERVVVAGGINKAMVFSNRFVPEWLTTKLSEAFYTDVKPEDRKREPGDVARKYAAHS